MSRRLSIAITHAASRPCGYERHPMPAFIATPLVATKRAGGDVAIFLRAIVAGKYDERIFDEFPAGASWIRCGCQPIDQST